MCVCHTAPRYSRRHRLRLILARGQLRPPLHPPDQGVPPLDPTRRASPSGLPTGRCFTLRPPDRCFDSGFDQESLRALHGPPDRGRLRSPPGPPSTRRVPPWTCTRAVRPSTAAGLSRPCPTTNRQADWMRPPGGRPMSGQRGSEKRQRSVIIQSRVAPRRKSHHSRPKPTPRASQSANSSGTPS